VATRKSIQDSKDKKPAGATESGRSKKAVKAPKEKGKAYGYVGRAGATRGRPSAESFGTIHRKTPGLGVPGSGSGASTNRTTKKKPKSAKASFFLK
jgi:hypothetical protein